MIALERDLEARKRAFPPSTQAALNECGLFFVGPCSVERKEPR
jgi:hypothetical protein